MASRFVGVRLTTPTILILLTGLTGAAFPEVAWLPHHDSLERVVPGNVSQNDICIWASQNKSMDQRIAEMPSSCALMSTLSETLYGSLSSAANSWSITKKEAFEWIELQLALLPSYALSGTNGTLETVYCIDQETSDILQATLNDIVATKNEMEIYHSQLLLCNDTQVMSQRVGSASNISVAFHNDLADDVFLVTLSVTGSATATDRITRSGDLAINCPYGTAFRVDDQNDHPLGYVVPIKTGEQVFVSRLGCVAGEGFKSDNSICSLCNDQTLKSEEAVLNTQVDFVNYLQEPIKVFWIDFNGSEIEYATSILPGQEYRQASFVGYPWRVRTFSGQCVGTFISPRGPLTARIGTCDQSAMNLPKTSVFIGAAVFVDGQVWEDQDGDGSRDLDEILIANVTVRLLPDNGTGTPGLSVAETKTDMNGRYIFRGVNPHVKNWIEFEAPAGRDFTVPNSALGIKKDSRVDPDTGLSEEIIIPVGVYGEDVGCGLLPTDGLTIPMAAEATFSPSCSQAGCQQWNGAYNYVVIGSTMSLTDAPYSCNLRDSSAATLTIPNGASIEKAYLYYAGSGHDSDVSSARLNNQLVQLNHTWSSEVETLSFFGALADVTDLISKTTTRQVIWVSGIADDDRGDSDSTPWDVWAMFGLRRRGSNRRGYTRSVYRAYDRTSYSDDTDSACRIGASFAAWTMVVVYKEPKLEVTRRINFCYSDFHYTYPAGLYSAMVNCVNPPANVEPRITMVGFEGDSWQGDTTYINGQRVGYNVFRGSSGPDLDIIDARLPTTVLAKGQPGTLEFTLQSDITYTAYGWQTEGILIPIHIVAYET